MASASGTSAINFRIVLQGAGFQPLPLEDDGGIPEACLRQNYEVWAKGHWRITYGYESASPDMWNMELWYLTIAGDPRRQDLRHPYMIDHVYHTEARTEVWAAQELLRANDTNRPPPGRPNA